MRQLSRAGIAALLLGLAGCASGGGSGGGGSGGPPLPPAPLTPYASNCSTTPSALSCLTATNTLVGSASERYAITGDPAGYFDARNSQYTIVVDRKGTATPNDDTFTYNYPDAASVTRMSFSNFTIANTPLGVVRTANGADAAGRTGTMDLYEISNVLGGGLDYVQLGRITGTVAPIRQGASYFAVGQQHLASNLPTTGTARFSGGTRGTYIDGAGAAVSTASDISMNVNFGTLSLTGSTSNFRATNASGASVTPPSGLDFTFNASIYTDPAAPRPPSAAQRPTPP